MLSKACPGMTVTFFNWTHGPYHYKDLVVQTCFMGRRGGAQGRSTGWMGFPFSALSGEYMFIFLEANPSI